MVDGISSVVVDASFVLLGAKVVNRVDSAVGDTVVDAGVLVMSMVLVEVCCTVVGVVDAVSSVVFGALVVLRDKVVFNSVDSAIVDSVVVVMSSIGVGGTVVGVVDGVSSVVSGEIVVVNPVDSAIVDNAVVDAVAVDSVDVVACVVDALIVGTSVVGIVGAPTVFEDASGVVLGLKIVIDAADCAAVCSIVIVACDVY